MFRRVSARGLALGLLALVATIACKQKDSSQNLRIGIAIPSYVHGVVWIAQERGAFGSASAKVSVMGGSAATVRTLLAKRIDVGLAGGDAVIKANLAGGDLVIVASLVERFYHRLVASGEIKKPADLRGKKIGLPFLGGPQDMAVKYALKEFGLVYNRDVQVVSLGKEFNRMAAISRGDIAATTSQAPRSQLAKLKVRVLLDLPKEADPFPYMVMVVRRSDLVGRRSLLLSTLKGLCDATKFYRAPENQRASLKLLQKYMKSSETEGAAMERLSESGPGLLNYPPKPSLTSLKTTIDFMELSSTQSKDALSRLVDTTLLEDAKKNGYCR